MEVLNNIDYEEKQQNYFTHLPEGGITLPIHERKLIRGDISNGLEGPYEWRAKGKKENIKFSVYDFIIPSHVKGCDIIEQCEFQPNGDYVEDSYVIRRNETNKSTTFA